MKVGMVCPYSVSWPGGVQSHALSLARQLNDIGHEVRVIAPCDGQPPTPEVISVGHSIPVPANGSIARLSFGPGTAIRIRRALEDEDFEVLHIHEPLQAGVSLLALVQAGGIPVVGSFHAAADELAAYAVARPLLARLHSKITVKAAVSPAAAALARKYFGGEYRLLPNGIDTARLASAEPAERDPDEFVVLFVGRLEPRKGCEYLVKAWKAVTKEIPMARLWIVGDGPERDSLAELAEGFDRVDFLGASSGGDLTARFKAADVFCAPSVSGESFGIVLLEAMAAGTPVVATSLEGYSAVAGDGAALLVPPADPAALARALISVAKDPTLAGSLVSAGLDRAERYSWERLVADVERAYGDAMAHGRVA